jgi:hypothetical protein
MINKICSTGLAVNRDEERQEEGRQKAQRHKGKKGKIRDEDLIPDQINGRPLTSKRSL